MRFAKTMIFPLIVDACQWYTERRHAILYFSCRKFRCAEFIVTYIREFVNTGHENSMFFDGRLTKNIERSQKTHLTKQVGFLYKTIKLL